MKVDPEINSSKWYQIIRPVALGFHARKPPEIRALDLEGECNAEFWSKIPWQLAQYSRKREFYSFVRSPNDEYLRELGKTASCKDVAAVIKQCRLCSDQNAENNEETWDSAEPAYPECSEKSNIEAIKAFLGQRRNDLEKRILGGGKNPFGKYGLGSHAGKLAGDGNQPYSDDEKLMNKFDNLFKMIDRMTEERMNVPGNVGEDVFDKNHPITGKVGFWRDEINGIREFTDLDEVLDFGDLENDGDFKNYLVQKGRGRFDSKGNFILTTEHELSCEDASDVDHTDDNGKWYEKGTSSLAKSTTVHDRVDRKLRKYPNWDFPICNYPRWIHQMYRMDQVKIGQLVKQGSGAPQYCSPWTVCRDQDKMRDKSKATSIGELSRRDKHDQGSDAEEKYAPGEQGGRRRGKHTKQAHVEGKRGQNEADRAMNKEGSEGPTAVFDLNKFLESFEKEQQELSKLETDSYGQIVQKDEFEDITDLIDEYHSKLREEDDLLKGTLRRRAEEREQMIKRRQDAARKALADLQKKKLQEASLKRRQQGNESLGMKESLGRKSKYSKKSSAFLFRDDRRAAKRRPPPILVCRRMKSLPIDKAKEMECLDRFNVLLDSRPDRAISQDKFIELAKQIPMLVQSGPPKKLTPCERLKPILRSNGLV